MWRLFAASGAMVLAAGLAPLHSEEFPWCVKMDVFTRNCAFANYNDCAAIARNAEATCVRNPNYQAPAAAAVRPKPAASKSSPPQR
jgi:hypothetical protein